MSICIDKGQITKEFLESLKAPEEKPALSITISELSISCEEAFDLYAEPLKAYLLEQERKSQD